MADVALRMAGARYLPDHRIVVFDEAHHLHRVATEGLGLRLAHGTLLWHLRRLHPRRAPRSLLADHGSARACALVEALRQAAETFFASLGERLAEGGHPVALGDAILDDPLSPALAELAEEVTACAAKVGDLSLRTELQARARGLSSLAIVVGALLRPAGADSVRWIEPGRRSPELRSAPIEVSQALGQWVFSPERTCILLSATLGPPDDREFDWLRKQLGIRAADAVRLGSPFDYRHRVKLDLAEAMPDPVQDPSGFLRECKERTVAAVLDNGGRALVLCTSWHFVKELASAIRARLEEAGLELLVQGDSPLRHLLDRKRARPTSVLIGTESLWEGIDVPGDALTLVVVTRLPFAQPDHPLTRARLGAIAARGGDPFLEHSLPEAILKFRQGFGRLIRSARDHGRVLVLDPRARTRAYGRRFLDALPECGGDDAR
jgi:ATP-dependent DNA helicase DinG